MHGALQDFMGRAQREQGAKGGSPVSKPPHRTPTCGLPSGVAPSWKHSNKRSAVHMEAGGTSHWTGSDILSNAGPKLVDRAHWVGCRRLWVDVGLLCVGSSRLWVLGPKNNTQTTRLFRF